MKTPNDVRKEEFFLERDITLPNTHVDTAFPTQPEKLSPWHTNEERKRAFFSERDIAPSQQVIPPETPVPPAPLPDLPAPDYPAPDFPISPQPRPETPLPDDPRPQSPGPDTPAPMPDPNEPRREFPPL